MKRQTHKGMNNFTEEETDSLADEQTYSWRDRFTGGWTDLQSNERLQRQRPDSIPCSSAYECLLHDITHASCCLL